RHDGLEAQNKAAERVRAGDHDGALAILTEYLSSLQQEQIDPSQRDQLRRPIDARVSQYKLLREQRQLVSGNAAHREDSFRAQRERQNAEELKKKNVEKLMREFNALYREGKYIEAEAR